jgi:hypothetical protein
VLRLLSSFTATMMSAEMNVLMTKITALPNQHSSVPCPGAACVGTW